MIGLQPANGTFEFRPGPVFANVVLGDEINRASPEDPVGAAGGHGGAPGHRRRPTYPVPRPFLVIATQNPMEHEGTYPLPESPARPLPDAHPVGYPDGAAEADILDGRARGGQVPEIGPVIRADQAAEMIRLAANVHIDATITRYVVRLAAATRDLPEVRLGLSTRGALALVRAAQAHALGEGRDYVVPQDIKFVAKPVAAHRLILTAEAEVEGRLAESLVDEVLASVLVPVQA